MQTVTFSNFVKRWSELRGHVNASKYRAIGMEAIERSKAVEFRAVPLCFRDLAERLEIECGAIPTPA